MRQVSEDKLSELEYSSEDEKDLRKIKKQK